MEKISLQKKSFFNSIGLNLDNIPSELKLRASVMQEMLPEESSDFLLSEDESQSEYKYFCLKSLFGTDKEEYNDKTWLEILMENEKSDDIIKQYTKNPNYYFSDLRKQNQDDLNHNGPIVLYEDNGKFFAKDGIARLALMMVKYLLEMSRTSSKEEKQMVNKQYIFSAKVISIPEDREVVYLTSMLRRIYGAKLEINIKSAKACNMFLKYGGQSIEIKNKKDLQNFVKNSYMPKELKSEEKLKSKMDNLAQIGLDYVEDGKNEELYMYMGEIFNNYDIFVKYYQKMQDFGIEDNLYKKVDLSDISYEQILNKLVKLVKQEETFEKNKAQIAEIEKTTKESLKEGKRAKVVSDKKEKEDIPEKDLVAEIKKTVKGKHEEQTDDKIEDKSPEALKKSIDEKIEVLINSIEMMFYKFKTEESNVFELANETKVALNIDRINDDTVSSALNSIKSNTMELKAKISEEEDTYKLENINKYVVDIRKKELSDSVLGEYIEEMKKIFGACLNKHTQRIITDAKLNKLEIQREEIESEKCSFFSKLIGKAKLKQAKLDNINLKKQLILSESQFADKLHYYMEDGLSDLYAYTKSEEDQRGLEEAKEFLRTIEVNMKIQNLLDNNKLNKLIKEKVEQKRNLPQLVLSKEKKKLFSKAQINLMEEKNNELKRVIQITRANSLKQQNTGMIPILGNIKSTKAFHNFCKQLARIDSAIRSLL